MPSWPQLTYYRLNALAYPIGGLMDIECPGCGKYNRLDIGYVDCASCKAQLSGIRYRKVPGAIGSAIGLGVLVATVQFADEGLSPKRLPLANEYELVSQCVSGHSRLVYEPELRQLTTVCTCAVEEASSVTPIAAFLAKPKDFTSRMREALPGCISKSG